MKNLKIKLNVINYYLTFWYKIPAWTPPFETPRRPIVKFLMHKVKYPIIWFYRDVRIFLVVRYLYYIRFRKKKYKMIKKSNRSESRYILYDYNRTIKKIRVSCHQPTDNDDSTFCITLK
jgi:hypothetical protein